MDYNKIAFRVHTEPDEGHNPKWMIDMYNSFLNTKTVKECFREATLKEPNPGNEPQLNLEFRVTVVCEKIPQDIETPKRKDISFANETQEVSDDSKDTSPEKLEVRTPKPGIWNELWRKLDNITRDCLEPFTTSSDEETENKPSTSFENAASANETGSSTESNDESGNLSPNPDRDYNLLQYQLAVVENNADITVVEREIWMKYLIEDFRKKYPDYEHDIGVPKAVRDKFLNKQAIAEENNNLELGSVGQENHFFEQETTSLGEQTDSSEEWELFNDPNGSQNEVSIGGADSLNEAEIGEIANYIEEDSLGEAGSIEEDSLGESGSIEEDSLGEAGSFEEDSLGEAGSIEVYAVGEADSSFTRIPKSNMKSSLLKKPRQKSFVQSTSFKDSLEAYSFKSDSKYPKSSSVQVESDSLNTSPLEEQDSLENPQRHEPRERNIVQRDSETRRDALRRMVRDAMIQRMIQNRGTEEVLNNSQPWFNYSEREPGDDTILERSLNPRGTPVYTTPDSSTPIRSTPNPFFEAQSSPISPRRRMRSYDEGGSQVLNDSDSWTSYEDSSITRWRERRYPLLHRKRIIISNFQNDKRQRQ